MMVVRMRMGVRLVNQLARELAAAVGEKYIHLGGPEAAAIHLLDANADAGEAESVGQSLEPCGRSTRGYESAEHHVAADAGGRIQNGKASI
jgi:hypothetical protein